VGDQGNGREGGQQEECSTNRQGFGRERFPPLKKLLGGKMKKQQPAWVRDKKGGPNLKKKMGGIMEVDFSIFDVIDKKTRRG